MRRSTPQQHRNRVAAAAWQRRQLAEQSARDCPEISRVISRLWQGALPQWPEQLQGFDVLLLCALELQPPSTHMPVVRVVRIPLDDAKPSVEDVRAVRRTARRCAQAWRSGQRLLITCAAGLNRSGLITGLTLRQLGYSGDQAVTLIRQARGPNALSNRWFEQLVRKEA